MAFRFPFPDFLLSFLPISQPEGLADLNTIEGAVNPNRASTPSILPAGSPMWATFQVPAIRGQHGRILHVLSGGNQWQRWICEAQMNSLEHGFGDAQRYVAAFGSRSLTAKNEYAGFVLEESPDGILAQIPYRGDF